MNVTREVILDLLPVYMSGEASPDSRSLVEEYLRQDPAMAEQIRAAEETVLATASPTLSPEPELKALRRTRRVLVWQRLLFAQAVTYSALGLMCVIQTEARHLRIHGMIGDDPMQSGAFLILGILSWIAYGLVRRHLRTTAL